jgi:hypothetical protein
LLAAACALASIHSTSARVDACSQHPIAPEIFEPIVASSDVVVDTDDIELACGEDAVGVTCRYVETVRLRNVTTHAASVAVGVLLSPRTTRTIEIDESSGALALATALEPDWGARLDREHDPSFGDHDIGASWPADVVRVDVAPSSTRVLVVRGVTRPEGWFAVFGSACDPEPIVMRHPVAARGETTHVHALHLYLSPSGEGANAMHVRLRRPRAWHVALVREHGPEFPVTSIEEGDTLIDDAVVPRVAGSSAIDVTLRIDRSTFFNGGPFLGVGWWFAPDAGPRLRVGYEVAAPHWLVYSLAEESDLRKHLVVAPAIDWIGNGGSSDFTFGLGAPVRARPDVRFGARAQASVDLAGWTLRGAIDLFPRTHALPTLVEGSLMLQLSL